MFRPARTGFLVVLSAVVVWLTGCGSKPPPLHDVHGKVTLKGKPHARLSIHFKPKAGDVTMYNMGVAETDKDGNFKTVMGAGGNGLEAGEYKVTFSYMVMKSGKAVPAGEKPDDAPGRSMVTTEMVGKPYDPASEADTPVTLTVKPGDNEFTFDIPTATK